MVSYTRGLGRLFCSLKGYEPCKNQEEIVEQIGYDSERDLDNPTGSVFCAHGAGFVVPWYQDVYKRQLQLSKKGGTFSERFWHLLVHDEITGAV